MIPATSLHNDVPGPHCDKTFRAIRPPQKDVGLLDKRGPPSSSSSVIKTNDERLDFTTLVARSCADCDRGNPFRRTDTFVGTIGRDEIKRTGTSTKTLIGRRPRPRGQQIRGGASNRCPRREEIRFCGEFSFIY